MDTEYGGGVRCDYPSCITPAIGYGDRQLQGPFYCQAHEAWAMAHVKSVYAEVDAARDEEDATGDPWAKLKHFIENPPKNAALCMATGWPEIASKLMSKMLSVVYAAKPFVPHHHTLQWEERELRLESTLQELEKAIAGGKKV